MVVVVPNDWTPAVLVLIRLEVVVAPPLDMPLGPLPYRRRPPPPVSEFVEPNH